MKTLALFVLLAASLTHAMYFHIAETEQKCLIEDVPEEIMVIGKYKVQLYDPIARKYGEHPELGMYVVVRDPNGKIILSKLYTSEGRFTFTAHAPGEHTICLYSNSSSWFSHNELLVQLDLHTGELVNDYRDIAAKEKLTDLQLRVRQLLDQADQIIKMQAYQRSREERFRETSENTSNRVTMWIIAQTVTLVLTGIWQMRNLKRFFEAKKLV